MAKDRRNCRRVSRKPGMPDSHNYHSARAMKRAMRREKIAKASRKLNHKLRKARR